MASAWKGSHWKATTASELRKAGVRVVAAVTGADVLRVVCRVVAPKQHDCTWRLLSEYSVEALRPSGHWVDVLEPLTGTDERENRARVRAMLAMSPTDENRLLATAFLQMTAESRPSARPN